MSTSNDRRKSQILRIINDIFSDTGVPMEETIDYLTSIREEVNAKLAACRDDAAEDD
jgi:3'-phosphoadenosine 5'-phosphosulfate sulfotransferase (PAPS reductase)/FAD synthetase